MLALPQYACSSSSTARCSACRCKQPPSNTYACTPLSMLALSQYACCPLRQGTGATPSTQRRRRDGGSATAGPSLPPAQLNAAAAAALHLPHSGCFSSSTTRHLQPAHCGTHCLSCPLEVILLLSFQHEGSCQHMEAGSAAWSTVAASMCLNPAGCRMMVP